MVTRQLSGKTEQYGANIVQGWDGIAVVLYSQQDILSAIVIHRLLLQNTDLHTCTPQFWNY